MEKRKNTFMNNVAAILGSQFLIQFTTEPHCRQSALRTKSRPAAILQESERRRGWSG